ncbi:MAG: relaxase/mobilization nuclease domain-containing protein [Bacteroidetes bacterium]|nr:relaxase/mobilization nuclease domain-containing protein [Bacteroidota bacterium]
MIIKSKTRKDKSFDQLLDYLFREETEELDERRFTLAWGFDAAVELTDVAALTEVFMANSKYMRGEKRVKMYHEIASFAPEDSGYITKAMLMDIAENYRATRASRSLCICRPHFDKGHIHLHFMFSGNEKGTNKSIRVNKQEFAAQKERINDYQKERYPQLEMSYHQRRRQPQLKRYREQEQRQETAYCMERYNKPLSQRTALQEVYATTLQNSVDFHSLLQQLTAKGYEVYKRGEIPTGVVVEGRKYRFSTLALDKESVLQTEQYLTAERKRRDAGRLLLQDMQRKRTKDRGREK